MSAYREPGKIPPDDLAHLKERAADVRRHADSAMKWAWISMGFAVINLIFQLLRLSIKYNWW